MAEDAVISYSHALQSALKRELGLQRQPQQTTGQTLSFVVALVTHKNSDQRYFQPDTRQYRQPERS